MCTQPGGVDIANRILELSDPEKLRNVPNSYNQRVAGQGVAPASV